MTPAPLHRSRGAASSGELPRRHSRDRRRGVAITVLPLSSFADTASPSDPGKRGIQLYTVRDVISRAPTLPPGGTAAFQYFFRLALAYFCTPISNSAGYPQSRRSRPADHPGGVRSLMDDTGCSRTEPHRFIYATIEAQLESRRRRHAAPGHGVVPQTAGTSRTVTGVGHFNRWVPRAGRALHHAVPAQSPILNSTSTYCSRLPSLSLAHFTSSLFSLSSLYSLSSFLPSFSSLSSFLVYLVYPHPFLWFLLYLTDPPLFCLCLST